MITLARLVRRRFAPAGLGALVLILLIVWGIGHVGAGDARPAAATSTATAGPAHGVGTIAFADLPKQAHHTLALIAAGGPFPYEHDGVVYRNREGVLPTEPGGYYHEYTVPTPGSADRGARRIVKARDGTLYYTGDHYRSFERIVQ